MAIKYLTIVEPSLEVRIYRKNHIFYSEQDEGYVADIPDLKACSAFGETPDRALAEVLAAKESWLAAARSNGKTIPAPKYRPIIYRSAA